MAYLWNIIQFSFSSLIWGILIALLCMALFVFIIKGWWKNALFTIWSYLIGAILFIFLVFQCTMIVGSLKIIDTCEEYEVFFRQVVDSAYEGWEEVTKDDSDIIIKKTIAEYPLLEYYIGGGDFRGFNAKQLPTAMADELRSFMWAYIVRRLLWCLGLVLVAGVLGIKTLDQYNKSQRQTRSYMTNQRHVSGTSRRPHISRRR
jgi:small-conductance mechanosensitive channel